MTWREWSRKKRATQLAVDRVSEELLVEVFEREVAPTTPLVLIAEGLEGGQVMLPRTLPEAEAVWRIIVDPIDGTRALCTRSAAPGF